jgi:hypothetical protein
MSLRAGWVARVYEQMIFPIVALSVRCVFGHDGNVLTWFDASVAVGLPIPFWGYNRTSRDSLQGKSGFAGLEGRKALEDGISRSRAAVSRRGREFVCQVAVEIYCGLEPV